MEALWSSPPVYAQVRLPQLGRTLPPSELSLLATCWRWQPNMPKLKVLLACEKIIFDQSGPVSLISIFQRMNIQRNNVPLPDNAVSPSMWSIFVLWESNPREIGQQFTQVLRVTAPDGSVFAESEGIFTNASAEDSQIRTKTLIPGLPISREGWVVVSTWLKGDEAFVTDYRFEIKYVFPDQPQDLPEPENEN